MSLSKVNSCGLLGIDGYIISVETDISNGIPSFEIVGLPDTAVRESKERIRSAVKNSGLIMPAKKITVNLAPANIKKGGAYLDLPIAMGILLATKQTVLEQDAVFIGELALDGALRGADGVLPMVISAAKNGIKRAFVPFENAREAGVVKGIEIYGARSLEEILLHLTGQKEIEPFVTDTEELFSTAEKYLYDFAEVKGQEQVKRALEIAAAGGHNILMIGPPGSGKTMLAQRVPTILPDLSFDEALEVTKIHSISGVLESPLVTARPFRSPHHTISAVGLSGGGTNPRPGEISLAHNGVLFLDELPEFHRDALEVLRQPLEDQKVTISRTGGTFSFPSNFMLVASTNPCPCGFNGDPNHECKCTQAQIQKYIGKISGPLLDRIDIHIEVPAVKYEDLETRGSAEKSADIKARVDKARKLQLERYKDTGVYSNSMLTPALIEKYCQLDEKTNALLKNAFDSLGLSARAHNRILKVARTVADLEGREKIETGDILEAIQYRTLDRKFSL